MNSDHPTPEIDFRCTPYVGGYRRARGRRLVGFFAGMYSAGLGPEEAVVAAPPDCRLLRTVWGRLILHRTLPQAGRRWTATGQS